MKITRKRIGWLALVALALGSATMAPRAQAQTMDDMKMDSGQAQMLIQTLSEEKTEIAQLAAQQAKFKIMGDRDSMKLASMWGRWIREHKAASPMLMKLIKKHGGDPMRAQVLKTPSSGTMDQMLRNTHMDHQAAVMTSQIRYSKTSDPMVKKAMHARANLARKHLNQMAPYYHMSHPEENAQQNVAMMCPHCNVAMVDGVCPKCGMTMKQMKKDKM